MQTTSSTSSGPNNTLSRLPLLGPCLGAIIGIFLAHHAWWLLLSLLVTTAVFVGFYSRQKSWILAGLTILVISLLHHKRVTQQTALEDVSINRTISLRGTILQSKADGSGETLFRTFEGTAIRLLKVPSDYPIGRKLKLQAYQLPPQRPANPTAFNEEKILKQQGIYSTFVTLSAEPIGWHWGLPFLRRQAASLKDQIGNRITRSLSDPEAIALIRGVTLGEKDTNGSSFISFRRTGTMHIFAVSGLHVGLIALLIMLAGRLCRVSPRTLTVLVIFGMYTYAFVTGLQAPALRAALMGSFLLGRFLFLRSPSALNNLLAAALIILIWDSFSLFQLGFQLSFVVVLSIAIIGSHLWKKLQPTIQPDPFIPEILLSRWDKFSLHSRSNFFQTLTISTAAWLGSIGLTLLFFGWFTPVAIVASIPLALFAFCILSLSFLSFFIGLIIPVACPPINQINAQAALLAKDCATLLETIPGAYHRFRKPPPWKNGLCIFQSSYGGAAIHLDTQEGTFIDAGNRSEFRETIRPLLDSYRIESSNLIASHNDSEHVGGFHEILLEHHPQQLVYPPLEENYSLGEILQLASKLPDCKLLPAHSGLTLTLDPHAHVTILSVGESQSPHSNDRCLIMMLHWHQWRILITNDAPDLIGKELLATKTDLKADLWIAGRHHYDFLQSNHEFVTAVSPAFMIVNDAIAPPSEIIPKSTQKYFESLGITLLRQSKHGAIFVHPSKNKITLEGFRSKNHWQLSDN